MTDDEHKHKARKQQEQSYVQSYPALLKGHTKSVLCLDHSSRYKDNHKNDNGERNGLDSTLLSGSEDGTCRLWDLRCSTRAALCMFVGRHHIISHKSTTPSPTTDVMSVHFGPKWSTSSITTSGVQEEDSASPSVQLSKEYSVYATVENNVYGYDLRYIQSPIINVPSIDFSTLLQCTDEINHIAIWTPPQLRIMNEHAARKHSKNNNRNSQHTSHGTISSRKACYLATADDSGTVHITNCIENFNASDSDSSFMNHVCSFIHDDSSLVTSLAFTPKATANGNNSAGKQHQQQVLLASGGTDCCIRLWDVTTSFRNGSLRTKQHLLQQQQSSSVTSTAICTIFVPTQSSDDSTNQICNPPMVHCLQYSPSGKLLVGGLGDGSVIVMKQSNARLVVSSRLYDAHSSTVASCLFPAWTSINKQEQHPNHSITAHDRLLCTMGNDGCIVLWDLGCINGGEKATNPSIHFPMCCDDENDREVYQNNSTLRAQQTAKGGTDAENDSSIDEPKTLFAFQHPIKPNWMVNSGSNDTSYPFSLFVTDTSNDISVYTIPVQ